MTLHPPFAVALLACLLWTTLFSMFNRPGIRGYRNLGILAAYVCLLVFFFRAGWRSTITTWALFGLIGGVVYTLWEIIQRVKTKEAEKPKVGLLHVVSAMALWPVMLPEALEYSLAELGILKVGTKEPDQPSVPTSLETPMKDLDLLWALTGQTRAQHEKDWNQYFDPIGLILVTKLERWEHGGFPQSSLAFATTGGDSVHFSFLRLPDRPLDQCPVIMTLPCAEEMNIVLGENLRDFLGLGCRGGYFTLEQLEYTPEEQIPFLDSQSYEPDADEEQIALLKKIESRFELSPPSNVALRLAELKQKYGHLLQ